MELFGGKRACERNEERDTLRREQVKKKRQRERERGGL